MCDEHEDEEGNITRILEEKNNIRIFKDEHDQKGIYLQLTENGLKSVKKGLFLNIHIHFNLLEKLTHFATCELAIKAQIR